MKALTSAFAILAFMVYAAQPAEAARISPKMIEGIVNIVKRLSGVKPRELPANPLPKPPLPAYPLPKPPATPSPYIQKLIREFGEKSGKRTEEQTGKETTSIVTDARDRVRKEPSRRQRNHQDGSDEQDESTDDEEDGRGRETESLSPAN